MRLEPVTPSRVTSFLARELGGPVEIVSARRLRGGLVADAVRLITVRHAGATGPASTARVVVKTLRGGATREATVYQHVAATRAAAFAPRLVGVDRRAADECDLYLDFVARREAWPWRAAGACEAVLARLARLHAEPLDEAVEAPLSDWEYDRELQGRVPGTLAAVAGLRREDALASLAPLASSVRRVCEALPRLRRQLLAAEPLGRAVLHGDVHPGNVLVRRRRPSGDPVLLDWGRARIGSPLEDVASWLQSLRYWEPEALRRHDTLLGAYLRARGYPAAPGREVRERYWLAAASNVLAGALAYHLHVARTATSPGHRDAAVRAARDALRVVRRADACSRA